MFMYMVEQIVSTKKRVYSLPNEPIQSKRMKIFDIVEILQILLQHLPVDGCKVVEVPKYQADWNQKTVDQPISEITTVNGRR